MNPPEIKWEEKSLGLHCCYVGGSGRFSYHFVVTDTDGTGWFCKYDDNGGRYEGRCVPGITDLKKSNRFVELDVFYKWMEENQHIWTRAGK